MWRKWGLQVLWRVPMLVAIGCATVALLAVDAAWCRLAGGRRRRKSRRYDAQNQL